MGAKAFGVSGWLLKSTSLDSLEDIETGPLTPEMVNRRDKVLETTIGEQLLTIARWAGDRGRAGDALSLRLLQNHLETLMDGAVQVVKNRLAKDGEP